jgi:hypothetical protein
VLVCVVGLVMVGGILGVGCDEVYDFLFFIFLLFGVCIGGCCGSEVVMRGIG